MKYTKFLHLLVAGLLFATVFSVSSCKDKDDPKPAPTVTLSDATFSGKIGDVATVTATVVAPEGLKELRVTKYLGTAVDPNFGTNGTEVLTDLSHSHDYELSAEGLTTPVRFNFTAEDNEGQTGSADFIITTEPSASYLLTTFDWLWKSKLGKCLDSDPETEQILDCEKDNYYSFNADGTYTLNFGAVTGTGGGTCDFDGFVIPTTWSLNADESELTLMSVNAFDPADVRSEVYSLTDFNTSSIKSTQTIDLTVFGCVVWDWKFDWSAQPK